MPPYKKIVLALDLSTEADQVLERARQFVERDVVELIFLHVVEPIVTESSYDLITTLPADFEQNRVAQAEAFLQEKRNAIGANNAVVRVEIGSIKTEILRVAREMSADLILVGTHGRHGVGLLLGSTANAILHGTLCDVLAVRINPSTS